MRITWIFLLVFVCCRTAVADSSSIFITKDVLYKEGEALSRYEKDQCRLDIYVDKKEKTRSYLLWFHGGGLTKGSKDSGEKWAKALAQQGIGVVLANYRLSPKVKYPAYVEDAAAAFAWLHKHVGEYGGNPNLIFVGGHSAGGYLAAMLGMDPRYLKQNGLSSATMAGFIPLSAQVVTHFTVRAEQKIDKNTIIVDEAAPLYYTRKDTPPLLLLVGDNDMPGRAKENDYFYEVLKIAANEDAHFQIIPNRNHGSIVARMIEPNDPVTRAILDFMEKYAPRRMKAK